MNLNNPCNKAEHPHGKVQWQPNTSTQRFWSPQNPRGFLRDRHGVSWRNVGTIFDWIESWNLDYLVINYIPPIFYISSFQSRFPPKKTWLFESLQLSGLNTPESFDGMQRSKPCWHSIAIRRSTAASFFSMQERPMCVYMIVQCKLLAFSFQGTRTHPPPCNNVSHASTPSMQTSTNRFIEQSNKHSSNQPITESMNRTCSASTQLTNAPIRRPDVLFACAALHQLRASGCSAF